MADKKKIFLAYTYRCLDLLYKCLYNLEGETIIGGLMAHHTEKLCCYAYTPDTSVANLALHKYGYNLIVATHTNKYKVAKYKLTDAQNKFIDDLISGILPPFSDALKIGIITSVDRYNPIFSQYYTS